MGRIVTLALAVLIIAPSAQAQTSAIAARVGILSLATDSAAPTFEAFRRGMRDIEGQNISLTYALAGGHAERLPVLAADLGRREVDVIVGDGPAAAVAAGRATRTIPVVGAVLCDPVQLGLAATLSRPGGNVTGLDLTVDGIHAKRLQLLKEVVPRSSRIAVLFSAPRSAYASRIEEMEVAAQGLGVELQLVEVQGAAGLESAFGNVTQGRAEAMLIVGSPASSRLERDSLS